MKKINLFPRTKSEAIEIANDYINDINGLAYDMDMTIEEAKKLAEIKIEGLRLSVICDGDKPLTLFFKENN